MTTKTARLFRNGRSEAVRIPKSWEFGCREVEMARTEDGLLLRRKARTVADMAEQFDKLPPLRVKRPRGDFPRKLEW